MAYRTFGIAAMARVSTVAGFAALLSKSPEAMLEQMQRAGLHHLSPEDPVTEADKAALLAHLKEANRLSGEAPNRTILLDVRRKRVLVRQGAAATQLRAMPTAEPIQSIQLTTDEYRTVRRAEQAGLLPGFESEGQPALCLDYLAYTWAVLTSGTDPAAAAEQIQLRQLFRVFLRKLAARVRRCCRVGARDVQDKAARVSDVVSCVSAEREATIHPAFAPPCAVI